VGLYILKNGIIHYFDEENGSLISLNLRAKNILAGESECVVFRDFDNKIKLCNFSVSPEKIN